MKKTFGQKLLLFWNELGKWQVAATAIVLFFFFMIFNSFGNKENAILASFFFGLVAFIASGITLFDLRPMTSVAVAMIGIVLFSYPIVLLGFVAMMAMPSAMAQKEKLSIKTSLIAYTSQMLVISFFTLVI